MLKIHSVTLTNFKKHHNAKFEFTKGLNSVVGKNGAGKSSIIDAIGIAVFNVSYITLKDTISYGQDMATIVVDFSFKDKTYTVRRVIGTKSLTELVSTDGDINLSSNKAVYEYLAALFRIDLSHIYKNILCINSSNITALFMLEQAKRKSVFGGIFGFDYYEEAWKNLREPQINIENSIKVHKNILSSARESLDNAVKYKDRITELEQQLIELYKLQEVYNENKSLLKQRDELRQQRASLNKSIAGLEKRISELGSKMLSTKPNVCNLCGSTINDDKYQNIVSDMVKELETLTASLEEQKEQLLENKASDANIVVSDVQDKTLDIGKISGIISVCKNESDKIETYQNKITEEESIVNKLLSKLENLTFIRNNVKKIPEILSKELCADVSEHASQLLSDIIDQNVVVSMDDTYGITVTMGSNTLEFHQLSDGQKVMTAISIRFAMINFLAGELGFAVLDEPTINLDKNHRTRLADSIGKMRVGQLLVITHDDSFNDGNIINI